MPKFINFTKNINDKAKKSVNDKVLYIPIEIWKSVITLEDTSSDIMNNWNDKYLSLIKKFGDGDKCNSDELTLLEKNQHIFNLQFTQSGELCYQAALAKDYKSLNILEKFVLDYHVTLKKSKQEISKLLKLELPLINEIINSLGRANFIPDKANLVKRRKHSLHTKKHVYFIRDPFSGKFFEHYLYQYKEFEEYPQITSTNPLIVKGNVKDTWVLENHLQQVVENITIIEDDILTRIQEKYRSGHANFNEQIIKFERLSLVEPEIFLKLSYSIKIQNNDAIDIQIMSDFSALDSIVKHFEASLNHRLSDAHGDLHAFAKKIRKELVYKDEIKSKVMNEFGWLVAKNETYYEEIYGIFYKYSDLQSKDKSDSIKNINIIKDLITGLSRLLELHLKLVISEHLLPGFFDDRLKSFAATFNSFDGFQCEFDIKILSLDKYLEKYIRGEGNKFFKISHNNTRLPMKVANNVVSHPKNLAINDLIMSIVTLDLILKQNLSNFNNENIQIIKKLQDLRNRFGSHANIESGRYINELEKHSIDYYLQGIFNWLHRFKERDNNG